MTLAVKFQAENPNKHPLMPDNWPWIVVPVETLENNLEGWILMSQEELEAYKLVYKTQYQQYENQINQEKQLIENVKNKVKRSLEFGQELILQFSTENILMGITQQEKTGAVVEYLGDLLKYIQTASLYEAVKEIDKLINNGVPAHLSPFVTEERLSEFKQKILSFLQSL